MRFMFYTERPLFVAWMLAFLLAFMLMLFASLSTYRAREHAAQQQLTTEQRPLMAASALDYVAAFFGELMTPDDPGSHSHSA